MEQVILERGGGDNVSDSAYQMEDCGSNTTALWANNIYVVSNQTLILVAIDSLFLFTSMNDLYAYIINSVSYLSFFYLAKSRDFLFLPRSCICFLFLILYYRGPSSKNRDPKCKFLNFALQVDTYIFQFNLIWFEFILSIILYQKFSKMSYSSKFIGFLSNKKNHQFYRLIKNSYKLLRQVWFYILINHQIFFLN